MKEISKECLLKQNEISRSRFHELYFMPFTLSSINPIFHVFFHHKMLDDYGECHQMRVVWIREISEMLFTWCGKRLAEQRRHPVESVLALTGNCSEHIRTPLWSAAGALKSLSLSRSVSTSTHPHLLIFVPLSKLFCCRMWLLNIQICGSRENQIKSGEKSLFEKWICRLRTIA